MLKEAKGVARSNLVARFARQETEEVEARVAKETAQQNTDFASLHQQARLHKSVAEELILLLVLPFLVVVVVLVLVLVVVAIAALVVLWAQFHGGAVD